MGWGGHSEGTFVTGQSWGKVSEGWGSWVAPCMVVVFLPSMSVCVFVCVVVCSMRYNIHTEKCITV